MKKTGINKLDKNNFGRKNCKHRKKLQVALETNREKQKAVRGRICDW